MKQLLLLSVFLFTATSQVLAVQYCPNDDFKIFKGYCYAFHTYTGSTWDKARKACQDKTSHSITVDLASILSEAENTFIYNEMKDKVYADFWIGFRRIEGGAVDEFEWVDGSPVEYKNWMPGEPNDQGGEECAEVMRTSNGQWNDIPCSHTSNAYVCKGKAYSGWEERGDYEYFIDAGSGDESLNWFEARAWCNENGGELASITSDSQTDIILELLDLMSFKNNLWIGLTKLEGDQTEWTWSDYTPYGSYKNWKYGYPKEESEYKHQCGAIRSDDSKGEWHNAHCDDGDHGFVCKRKAGDNNRKTTKPPVTGGGYCPRGYLEAGTKCFIIHTRNSDNGYTWSEAVEYCRNKATYLHDIATINDPLQQAVITSALQENSLPLWMGLYRTGAGNADWLWMDNAPNTYENWGPLEPISREAKCADVRPYDIPLGSWGARDCSAKQGFICQTFKDPSYYISTMAPTTPNKCTNGYIPFWYACYKLYTKEETWSDASSKCQAEGAQLVSIHHGAENAFIQSLIYDQRIPVWTGLRDSSMTGEYKWSDGWAVIYTLWGDGEPSQDPSTGGCVRLRAGDGSWEDYSCTAPQPYVCKKTDESPITPAPTRQGKCPGRTGWLEHGSYCYKFHTKEYQTWASAVLKCKEDSFLGNLVSVHNVVENKWIYQQLTQDGDLSSHVWTGMYRRLDTKGFAWNDLSVVSFEHWAPGEPNGEPIGQDCVSYHKNYPEMWQDQDCNSKQGFICKAPKEQYPTLPPTIPGYCPEGWTPAGHNCYYFQPNIHLEWIYARTFCKDLPGTEGNADLVTIKDAAEEYFVNTEMFLREDSIGSNDQFWLGLAKKKSSAPYMWVDGSTIDAYENWHRGEPSSADDGSKNCVFQYAESSTWADTDCGEFKGFACKMSKAPVTQTPGGDGSSGGLSGGAIAGIVIGTLIGVGLLAIVIGIVVFNINPASKVKSMVSGFSNPFYTSAEDTKPVSTPPATDAFA